MDACNERVKKSKIISYCMRTAFRFVFFIFIRHFIFLSAQCYAIMECELRHVFGASGNVMRKKNCTNFPNSLHCYIR